MINTLRLFTTDDNGIYNCKNAYTMGGPVIEDLYCLKISPNMVFYNAVPGMSHREDILKDGVCDCRDKDKHE